VGRGMQQEGGKSGRQEEIWGGAKCGEVRK
jgi:hypothetical protein